MKKRVIDLRDQVPLLDIVSYGRGGKSLTPAQKEHIARTVRRVPEVVVKVSGGARTVGGVRQHVDYIGREGKLGLEADTGEHLDGKGFERQLTEDWDLDLEAHERQTERSIRGRKPPKLVHNLIFSMPFGTPPDKVLQAVRKLALNEWQWKHRYAMALHTDDDHPHVHVVVKAVSEQGVRLNIKKATLRAWRQPKWRRWSIFQCASLPAAMRRGGLPVTRYRHSLTWPTKPSINGASLTNAAAIPRRR